MFRLRAASIGDSDAIAAIHTEARRAAMPYLPELHSDDETRSWVREIVLPSQAVWVATVGEDPAGYIAIDGSTVEALYVSPDHQGQGIGSALLQLAKDRSDGMLDLWTFQRNIDARRFYEARGFRAVEFTDGEDNEEREPDVRYEWERETN